MAGTVATRGGLGQLPLVPIENYPMLSDPGQLTDLIGMLQENVGGALSLRDIPRIVLPSGRGTNFEIQGAEGGKSEKPEEITGLMVGWRYVRLLFEPQTGLGTAPPLCSSDDGRHPVQGGLYGIGGDQESRNPSHTCEGCPMNQWGTRTNQNGDATRGKACGERLIMLVLREDEILPYILSAPPTSIKALRERFVRLVIKYGGIHYSSFLYRWRIETAEKGGNTYPSVKAEVVGSLEGARRGIVGSGPDKGPIPGSPAAAAYGFAAEFGKLLDAGAVAAREMADMHGDDVESTPGGLFGDGLGGDFDQFPDDSPPA